MRRKRSRRYIGPIVAGLGSAWPDQARANGTTRGPDRQLAPRPAIPAPSVPPVAEVPGLAPLPAEPTLRVPGAIALPAPNAPGEPDARPKPADDPEPAGVAISLPAALQLAGVKPLDIAAATIEVQQGLALLLQAKVLWIPNLNAGVDYFRHDGVQQNLFTGALFRKDRQSFFVGGGPSLYVALTDVIYEPLVQRRVVASRVANVQTARNDVLQTVGRAYFTLQDARGRLIGVEATIVRAQRLVDLAVGLAPALIAPLEINRAKAELQSLKQTREVAIRDWMVASAAWRKFSCSTPRPCSSRSNPRLFR